jgi:hypothetical protein
MPRARSREKTASPSFEDRCREWAPWVLGGAVLLMNGFARISGLDQSTASPILLQALRLGSVAAIFTHLTYGSWKRHGLQRKRPGQLGWPIILLYLGCASFLGFAVPPALGWLTLEWGGTVHRGKVVLTNLDAPSLDRGCRHPVRFRSLDNGVEIKTCVLPEAIRLRAVPGDTLEVRWITGALGRIFDGVLAVHPIARSDSSSASPDPEP